MSFILPALVPGSAAYAHGGIVNTVRPMGLLGSYVTLEEIEGLAIGEVEVFGYHEAHQGAQAVRGSAINPTRVLFHREVLVDLFPKDHGAGGLKVFNIITGMRCVEGLKHKLEGLGLVRISWLKVQGLYYHI
ncbi:MAG: hypothetical protein LBE13_02295 [Bacteroidales bacterium]|jgi:hypothetical protein|nr:hypothetical protein [Bacteroidales bacterium]